MNKERNWFFCRFERSRLNAGSHTPGDFHSLCKFLEWLGVDTNRFSRFLNRLGVRSGLFTSHTCRFVYLQRSRWYMLVLSSHADWLLQMEEIPDWGLKGHENWMELYKKAMATLQTTQSRSPMHFPCCWLTVLPRVALGKTSVVVPWRFSLCTLMHAKVY